jgi:hypothetical protein
MFPTFLLVAGGVSLTIAGFLIHPAIAFTVFGLLCLGSGIVLARDIEEETEPVDLGLNTASPESPE